MVLGSSGPFSNKRTCLSSTALPLRTIGDAMRGAPRAPRLRGATTVIDALFSDARRCPLVEVKAVPPRVGHSIRGHVFKGCVSTRDKRTVL